MIYINKQLTLQESLVNALQQLETMSFLEIAAEEEEKDIVHYGISKLQSLIVKRHHEALQKSTTSNMLHIHIHIDLMCPPHFEFEILKF